MQKFNPHYPGFGNKSHQVGSPICYAQCTFLVFIITLEMEGRQKWGEIFYEGALLFSCVRFFTKYWSNLFLKRIFGWCVSWVLNLRNVGKLRIAKVHILWEGHKILRNLHQLFVLCTASQIIGGDCAKFCGLLRIYELY